MKLNGRLIIANYRDASQTALDWKRWRPSLAFLLALLDQSPALLTVPVQTTLRTAEVAFRGVRVSCIGGDFVFFWDSLSSIAIPACKNAMFSL